MIRIPFTKWVLVKAPDNVPMPDKISDVVDDYELYEKPTGSEFVDMHVACLKERNQAVIRAIEYRGQLVKALEESSNMIRNLIEFLKDKGHEIADDEKTTARLSHYGELVAKSKRHRHNRHLNLQ